MLFHYKAATVLGKVEEGYREAINQQTLLLELQAQGLIPIKISVAKKTGFSLTKWRADNKQHISQKNILFLTGELATLLNAGLPLDRSLLILSQLTEDNPKLNLVVMDLLEKVKSGKSLANALESHQDSFGRFYLNMIRAGELGGDLGAVLNRLSDYMHRSQSIKSAINTALIYPAVLFVMSMISLCIMLVYVVPQFKELFDSAGKELPVSTQIVLSLSEMLKNSLWIIVLVILGLVKIVQYQLANPRFRRKIDELLLTIPLLSDVLITFEIARFARTFGTLLINGVSILQSLALVRETLSNLVLLEIVERAENAIKQGKQLFDALSSQPVFPIMALQMIKIGEETGNLENMLIKIADIYDEQLKNTIQRMLALLEPVLIISLGLIIGGIIVSILLAILSVNDLAI